MFGYPSTIPYQYERVPEQQNLWFIKSQVLKFCSNALSEYQSQGIRNKA